jgi:hypothetical protein
MATTPCCVCRPRGVSFFHAGAAVNRVDPKSPGSIDSPHGLILFDGVCVLCSRGCGLARQLRLVIAAADGRRWRDRLSLRFPLYSPRSELNGGASPANWARASARCFG